ncbi:endonuclease III domain-containing protein [Candidatus Bipolaricaulota bacterium]
MNRERLLEIFQRLHDAYGPQEWWPADDPLEVIVGGILTQRTTWTNAERAIAQLRSARLLSVAALHDASSECISHAIRPSGCYRAKAKKLKAFAAWIVDRHGGSLGRALDLPTAELRRELLAIYGIGLETADAILLYAAARPSFVVDAYTRRLFERLGWLSGGEAYEEIRCDLMDALPVDVPLFNEFHALFVRHAKAHCRAASDCDGCPLAEICPSSSPPGRDS